MRNRGIGREQRQRRSEAGSVGERDGEKERNESWGSKKNPTKEWRADEDRGGVCERETVRRERQTASLQVQSNSGNTPPTCRVNQYYK